jgi:hypothetical protein
MLRQQHSTWLKLAATTPTAPQAMQQLHLVYQQQQQQGTQLNRAAAVAAARRATANQGSRTEQQTLPLLPVVLQHQWIRQVTVQPTPQHQAQALQAATAAATMEVLGAPAALQVHQLRKRAAAPTAVATVQSLLTVPLLTAIVTLVLRLLVQHPLAPHLQLQEHQVPQGVLLLAAATTSRMLQLQAAQLPSYQQVLAAHLLQLVQQAAQ